MIISNRQKVKRILDIDQFLPGKCSDPQGLGFRTSISPQPKKILLDKSPPASIMLPDSQEISGSAWVVATNRL